MLLKTIWKFIAYQLFVRTANFVLFAVVALFVFILYRSLPFLTSGGVSRLVETFTSPQWFPNADPPVFGMLSLFYGSLVVTFFAMFFAVPIGIFSAIVLSDLVPFSVRQLFKPVIELLAAIPSVAFGFFAIKIVAPRLQEFFGFTSGTNALNAAIILAVMAVPTIVSVAEDAISGIGRELREASYSLGATRAETILHIVIPASWSGIAAAIILGTMRAVGETMVVWMAAGNAANMPSAWYRVDQVISGLGDAVRTMTATIAGDIGEAPADSLHRSALFTVGLILLLFTFAMNLLTELIVNRNKNQKNVTSWNFLNLLFLFNFCTERYFFNIGKYFRLFFDKAFTIFAYCSMTVLFFALGIIIVPIFRAGAEAVLFQETVEHRLFLWERFQRGDSRTIQEEFRECSEARQTVYRQLKNLSWLAPDDWIAEAGSLGRETKGRETKNRRLNRSFQNLCNACSKEELQTQFEKLESICTDKTEPVFRLAHEYYEIAKNADLPLRQQPTTVDPDITYSAAFKQIRTLITGVEGTGCILGPEKREGLEHLPPEVRYGPAHWSTAQKFLKQLRNATVWKQQSGVNGNILPREKTIIDRTLFFAGTPIENDIQTLFNNLEQNLDEMLRPRWTFYVQYFVDSATAGHYMGGIGPELLGTILISLFSILLALPLGVLTAAYLAEAAKDNRITKLLRLCISTLAGVPSIVFGLFGLAVIVEFITGKPCLLAGTITLALLILPVIIRTAEEAIRAVPQTYREAAAGLGATPVRIFTSVTFPAALPGILTGTILGISRAAGETAPLLFTCAVASGGFVAGSNILFQPTPVLSYAAYDMAVGDRLAELVPYNQFGLVATLIFFVLLLNMTAMLLRARISAQLRG
ncbi:MAG: phosphate ABC transporter permease subunit PstC [Planctomycetaceae bacterium]|jgi:phosphate ABC transporter permease protein PstC/phosphate ABC transporter permease subunit PstA|nr:phosphate ABC transporter permease subunit PstC [Planctomycetaceae bacterium]